MKTEILNLKIRNRILEADGPIFSGEQVSLRLAIDAGEEDASEHCLVLFGIDKSCLAQSAAFTEVDEGIWTASINTGTNEMAEYFSSVPPNASKQIGAMIVNTETGDVITRGDMLVISTPFPDDLIPAPQTYHYVISTEMTAAIEAASAALSTQIAGKADASAVTEVAAAVTALSTTVASKADSSTVSALADTVASKADSSTVTTLSTTVAVKADASTVEALSSDVAAIVAEAVTFGDLNNGLSGLYAEVSADLASKADSSAVEALSTTVAAKADSSTVSALADTVASKAESSTVADLSSAVGDASLIVRRSQYGGVGRNGEVKDIILTGADDEYPALVFNDEANGGDHYEFRTDGPEGDGGDWHEICLPNADGTIALDETAMMKRKINQCTGKRSFELPRVDNAFFIMTNDDASSTDKITFYSLFGSTDNIVHEIMVKFPHYRNRTEIYYSNNGPSTGVVDIFDAFGEYDDNLIRPDAEGWYTYRFTVCPYYDVYTAERLAYLPI